MGWFKRKKLEPEVRRRRAKRRLIVYGGLFAALLTAYSWQPIRVDWIPRQLPKNNPRIEPDVGRLFAKGVRIAIVVAHPDDSEFYLAPLLLKLASSGAELHQVVLTDGDKGYYPFQNAGENRRVRRLEQAKASENWNVHQLAFLAFPDGRLGNVVGLADRVRKELERIDPEYVISFDGDYPQRVSHGDHRVSGAAVATAVQGIESIKWILFCATIAPNYTVDVTKFWDEGIKLVAIHKSQFAGQKLRMIESLIFEAAYEAGAEAGYSYGVALRAVRAK